MKLAAPVEEIIHRQLGHLASRTTRSIGFGYEKVSTYRLYPITLSRPAGGRALTRVFCPSCQQDLGVIVASEAETLKSRKRWGKNALIVSPIVPLLAWAAALLILDGPFWLAVLVLFLLIAAGVFAFISTAGWLRDDGVGWSNKTPAALRTNHRIMRADAARRWPSR